MNQGGFPQDIDAWLIWCASWDVALVSSTSCKEHLYYAAVCCAYIYIYNTWVRIYLVRYSYVDTDTRGTLRVRIYIVLPANLARVVSYNVQQQRRSRLLVYEARDRRASPSEPHGALYTYHLMVLTLQTECALETHFTFVLRCLVGKLRKM